MAAKPNVNEKIDGKAFLQQEKFYASSGYKDELLWAAAWLHRSTDDKTYLDYLGQAGSTGGATTLFAWDDKFIGAQVLVLEGKTPGGLLWFLPWNNLRYTSTAVFVANAYSEYLNAKVASIQCPSGIVQPSDLNYCLGRITVLNLNDAYGF
ncbi:hypothetical protein D8674_030598 [Pyrus ussuriensis x Pyrus communis]|uniref:cellulase n=1 Tax=Pyrus ussuriensis x Pyrus communis TaxID=2448454 RepID=A0A5N5EW02_9ROSA|nr:hypothetical protein D8674_030598 [Pyrus ussuriensis x Pyrus communis]